MTALALTELTHNIREDLETYARTKAEAEIDRKRKDIFIHSMIGVT
jgi:hypothetical protein